MSDEADSGQLPRDVVKQVKEHRRRGGVQHLVQMLRDIAVGAPRLCLDTHHPAGCYQSERELSFSYCNRAGIIEIVDRENSPSQISSSTTDLTGKLQYSGSYLVYQLQFCATPNKWR